MTAISLRFYPTRLPDLAVQQLRHFAVEHYHTCPTFAEWLFDWAVAEQERRECLDREDCELPEADLPLIPVAKWTNCDIADALTAITILSYVVDDRVAGEFVDRLVMFIQAAAALRLKKSDGVYS